ncbi:MAG: HD-GYP domain-containing protein [Bacillota bacterium]|nr:HD-GYP domain-containing protein [Bacillota bacterium]
MHRIPTSDFSPGKVLARSVYTPSGELLLPEGTRLTERLRPVLTEWGVTEICVEDERSGHTKAAAVPKGTAGPEPVRLAYSRAVSLVAKGMGELRQGRPVSWRRLGEESGELAMTVAFEPGILEYLHRLHCGEDYTFEHSVKVGVLAALLAKWLGLAFTDQVEVAVAAVLHDAGKALVPPEILSKPGRLTPEEFEAAKAHSTAGYDLLAAEYGPDALPPRVALEHHERMDGRGYPRGLQGREALLASRIVAVADVYDAMTSDRVYQRGQPEYAVLAHLRESGFSQLDPRVTRAFVERLVYRTLGRLVRLSNGQLGRVVLVNAQEPGRPIVAVGNSLIDLRQHRDLSLVG